MTVRVSAFVQRVLSALLVLAFAAPLAAQPAQAVEGRVIDLTGAPVAGARVELVVAGQTRSVGTDSAGRFRFDSVPAGTYNLDVKVASNGQTVKSITGFVLSDRSVYTVVATGSASALQVLPLEDAKSATPAPGAPATGSGLGADQGISGAMTVLGAAVLALAVAAIAGTAAVRARSRAS